VLTGEGGEQGRPESATGRPAVLEFPAAALGRRRRRRGRRRRGAARAGAASASATGGGARAALQGGAAFMGRRALCDLPGGGGVDGPRWAMAGAGAGGSSPRARPSLIE
jgi:hypothetical protein